MIEVIDLRFLGNDHTIGSFLVKTNAGYALIESGPYSTFAQLESQLDTKGISVSDIKHVFLTHIHLDHAGAAWALAEMGARVYVHPFGYPHMADPSKLLESATRIYGEDMERLWSTLKPIPEAQMEAIEHEQEITLGEHTFKAWHTPGHAHHHIAWQLDGTLFTGDVAGVKIDDGPVVAPCPPPDIDLSKWEESLQLIEKLNPVALYLTHYGKITDIKPHLQALRKDLQQVSHWIKSRMQDQMPKAEMTAQFDAYVEEELRRKGVSETGIAQYRAANPAWMSVAGLIRYWKKQGLEYDPKK